MLEDIRNEHVLTPEVDRAEDLVEQLAGLADERLPLLILVRARQKHKHGDALGLHALNRGRKEVTQHVKKRLHD